MSRPAWARGLKHKNCAALFRVEPVAPRVGAWIETEKKCGQKPRNKVAPRVGAWIETYFIPFYFFLSPSRPAWARGLKLSVIALNGIAPLSRPAWARGLKRGIS